MKSPAKVVIALVAGFLIFTFSQFIPHKNKNDKDKSSNYELIAFSEASYNARIFAPGYISTHRNERDACFSPDMSELYYSINRPGAFIIYVKKNNGKWSQPEVAPFSGKYKDIEPAFSPDGKKLYFSSDRPKPGREEDEDFDIWYVEKTEKGWSDPVNPGAPINTEKNEFYPSINRDGSIYFTAVRDDALGMEDIYVSKLKDGLWNEPENLGEAVNTKAYEYNAFVDPDEEYLIFTSHGWDGSKGSGDLYISFRKEEGKWNQPVNMGDEINTPAMEYCPYVTPDKKYLFFTRQGEKPLEINERLTFDQVKELHDNPGNALGDIYWIKSSVIDSLKSL